LEAETIICIVGLNNPLRYTDSSGHQEEDFDVPLTLGAGHAAVRLSAGGASPRLYEGSGRHFEAGKVLGRTAMETHPAVALFNSGYQAVTGKDAIDYHELSTSERVWSGVGAGLEVAGKAAKVAAGVGTAVATVKAVEGANDASRAIKATRVVGKADELSWSAKNAGKWSKEKQALVEMAKTDKRRGGITKQDMQAYKDLNKELPDAFPERAIRGPEQHPKAKSPVSRELHGYVGPVDHIPLKKMPSSGFIMGKG